MNNEIFKGGDRSQQPLDAVASSEDEVIPPLVLSSRAEQDGMFFALYSHLVTHTGHEVRGAIKKEMIEENSVLRGVLKQLAVNLGKDKEYRPEDWLAVGITDFIPEDLLHKWANPSQTPHWTEEPFHKSARYFEKKLKVVQRSRK
jgi:hypothetical protein